jgi:hypothetical protein
MGMTYEKLGDTTAAHRYYSLAQQLMNPQRQH